jgi:hypothetical protein
MLLVGREVPTILGILLVFALVILGALVGCDGGGSEKGQGGDGTPPSLEEAREVVVRVSGTEGVPYTGDYGTIAGDLQIVDGTLENEPTEYEVEVGQGGPEGVTASFQKVQPGGGRLKAEILADDEVVVESTTYAEFGSVIVNWLPSIAPLGEGEGLFEEGP